ncbi:substrate-binding domain-containing protein [Cryobacterium luteum]|uniref:Sugar ABC transporter substrate-binding protein n=1 Tax=Cryobacterium luteum TaxID=1424661 RepID=A0A1H8HE00_9MICO|nr:substrate-binding domain-containing protein [Cryobacterium luteum]TFB86702.1 sugar ABC transporter substrate-binding protein [Cryobacterium luteum]SEN54194.1 monosaccharide ABC transporter substrate-binding protein, CUT2 family [Cryobacterium luteum]
MKITRTIRRATGIAIAGLTALSLTACGAGDPTANQGDDAGDRVTIGVTVYDMSSFITEGKEGIDRYAEENDIDILWNSAGMDVRTQANQIDQYISAAVDAIVVVPVQLETLQPQVAAAKAAGIPFLDVNATLNNSEVAGSVQPDDVAAGEQEAEMMMEALGGSGNVVILQGPLGGSGEINRGQGIDNVLAENPGITVLAKDTANWSRDEAINKVKNWISAFGGEIDGVIAQNDDMGLGAVQALREAGIEGVPVVGIDGIEDGLNAVENGDFIGTSLQNGTVQLATGVAVAAKIARGEEVDKNLLYLMPPITTDNVGDAIEHVVSDRPTFLDALSELIAGNLITGDIAFENLPGQGE